MSTYVGVVHKDKGSDYGVSFPDFPGCVSAGSTPEELQLMAQEALGLHIDGLIEEGVDIPDPMSVEEAKKKAKDAYAFIFVRALVPGKPLRVNVVLDSNIVAEIDRVASNRSAFLAEAARAQLQRRA